ncbi:MAG: LptF/LptG family permease [Vampirovibrio sp.]|nr:LptF/LptG family permease [Vampirovibrio sp.]
MMMMTTTRPAFLLERYLLVPLFLSIVACLALFTILWIAPEILLKLLQAFQAHKITLVELVQLLALQLPSVLVQSFPIATLIGCVFTIRRFSHDFELTALQALGVSFPQIVVRVLGLGVLLGGFLVFVQNSWLPWAGPQLQALYSQKNIKKPSSQSFVLPITSTTVPINGGTPQLDELLSVGDLQSTALTDVILLKFYPNASTLTPSGSHTSTVQRLIQSASGTYADNNTLILKQALIAEFSPDGTLASQRVQPEEVLSFPAETQALLKFRATNPEFLKLNQLGQYQRLVERNSLPQAYEWLKARIMERYLNPLALLLLLVIGLLLGQEPPRSRTAKPFTYAAVVLFTYLVAQPMALQLSYLGELSGWVAGAIPFMVLLLLLLGVYWVKPSMR